MKALFHPEKELFYRIRFLKYRYITDGCVEAPGVTIL